MEREEVIRMAKEANSDKPREDWNSLCFVMGEEALERFAALVAAEKGKVNSRLSVKVTRREVERAALWHKMQMIAAAKQAECAKVCEDIALAHHQKDGTYEAGKKALCYCLRTGTESLDIDSA